MKTATNVSIIKIIDLRPVDWDSGKRLAISTEECAECQRCGRRHAVVWVLGVEVAGEVEFWDVGATCAKRMVADGMIPELDALELREARKAARDKGAAEEKAKIAELAHAIAAEVVGLVEPAAAAPVGRNSVGALPGA